MIDIDKLEELAHNAPSGNWEVWTSNSWRRVYADQGCGRVRVIEPCVQRHDNHPDLMFGTGVKEWLEGVTPEMLISLIAEVRAFRSEAVAHQAFVDAFNAVSDGDSPGEMATHANWEAALAASRPYKQAAINAARGAK